MNADQIFSLNSELQRLSPEARIGRILKDFGVDKVALASSLGLEDQIITHMMQGISKASRVFTLDTGRLPQETYELMQLTMAKYGLKYTVLAPESRDLEQMIAERGPNLFYEGIEARKLCCNIRKVKPLKRMLANLTVWISGLRREQAVTRTDTPVLEWDEGFSLLKLNPLVDWSEAQVRDYIREHHIPYNTLHDHGYPTIGCAPCTRAVKPGEDIRAGRWWWESPEQKECGLHLKDGKLVRKGA